MTKKLIAAIVFVGVLLAGVVGYQIFGPDDGACKTALGQVIDESLARSMAEPPGPEITNEEARKMVRWPCRFQTEKQVQAWGEEITTSKLPVLFAESFAKAFEGE